MSQCEEVERQGDGRLDRCRGTGGRGGGGLLRVGGIHKENGRIQEERTYPSPADPHNRMG